MIPQINYEDATKAKKTVLIKAYKKIYITEVNHKYGTLFW